MAPLRQPSLCGLEPLPRISEPAFVEHHVRDNLKMIFAFANACGLTGGDPFVTTGRNHSGQSQRIGTDGRESHCLQTDGHGTVVPARGPK